MANLKYVIKEDTRKRCRVMKWDAETAKKFVTINLEQFHLLYEAKKIDFCIYVRVEDEVIEYIKPQELSRELLEQIWRASLKPEVEMRICLMKKDAFRFTQVTDEVRELKIKLLLQRDPYLDRKTLHVFANLSGASQMIVRGGITADVANRIAASASYMVSNLMNNELAMATLSRMISNDPTLYDHSAAVAMFAGIMGTQHLKKPLPEKDVATLAQCGLYHDTGKSCVPPCVLNKPGSLDPEEWVIMKSHTTLGYDELIAAVQQGAPVDQIVTRVALEHHERMTGKGYPHGKAGRLEDGENGIHLYTRVISIADAYSALLMQRVYKPALPSDKAIELMSKNAANDFDLDIFVPFVKGMQKSHQQLGRLEKKGEIYDCESNETVAQQILRKKGRDKLIA